MPVNTNNNIMNNNSDSFNNFGNQSQVVNNPPTVEFRYSHDFDTNGVLYYLGSYGNLADYTNPYTLSQVKVFFSSMGQGSYEDFVGRS